MQFNLNRREFIGGAAAGLAMAGCAAGPRRAGLADHKIRLAVAGVMGKGFSDWMPMVKSGLAEVVAFFDADANTVKRAAESIANEKRRGKLPADFMDPMKVPFYHDYRKMLDDADKLGIEAMTVSTSDHMHAPIAIRAMKMGIHVYVQKPLVRTLWEAKYFYDTAKANGVCTQMGNQGSGGNGFRRGVELLQSGILGDVKEVHVWTNRPVWPQGLNVEKYVASRTTGDKIPQGFNWDIWLGTAKERPFLDMYPAGTDVYDPWKLGKHVYAPFTWRGFFDFGAGAFGDMACHTMNLPFRGLELGKVTAAECTMIDSKNDIAYPLKSVVKLTYAERESNIRKGVKLPAVTLFWYDGQVKPSKDLMPQITALDKFKGKVPETGCLIVGSKGILCSCNDYGQESYIALNGEKVAKDTRQHEACRTDVVKPWIPRCAGVAAGGMTAQGKGMGAASLSADGHYIEFLTAINGTSAKFDETKSRCYSDVEYSIPMMEAILVGTVAQRVPGKLNWCTKTQQFDCPKANEFIKPFIRKGFEF